MKQLPGYPLKYNLKIHLYASGYYNNNDSMLLRQNIPNATYVSCQISAQTHISDFCLAPAAKFLVQTAETLLRWTPTEQNPAEP